MPRDHIGYRPSTVWCDIINSLTFLIGDFFVLVFLIFGPQALKDFSIFASLKV